MIRTFLLEIVAANDALRRVTKFGFGDVDVCAGECLQHADMERHQAAPLLSIGASLFLCDLLQV